MGISHSIVMMQCPRVDWWLNCVGEIAFRLFDSRMVLQRSSNELSWTEWTQSNSRKPSLSLCNPFLKFSSCAVGEVRSRTEFTMF